MDFTLLLFISFVAYLAYDSVLGKAQKDPQLALVSFDLVPGEITIPLTPDLVQAAVKRVAQTQIVTANAGFGRNIHWKGVIDYSDQLIVEARIFGMSSQSVMGSIFVWSGGELGRNYANLICFRWRIQDRSTYSKGTITKLTCEYYCHHSTPDSSLVIEKLQSEIENELYAATLSNPNAAQSASQLSAGAQSISSSSVSAQTLSNRMIGASSSSPPTVNANSLAGKQAGTVQVPKRSYSNIDLNQAVEAIETGFISSAILRDPIGGQKELRWETIDAGTNRAGAIKKKVCFSEYSLDSAKSDLTNELMIFWNFQVASSQFARAAQPPIPPEIELSIEWSGVFQVSTGDLIRELIGRTENLLKQAGAVPLQTHYQASLSQLQSKKSPFLMSRASAKTHWVYDANGNAIDGDELDESPKRKKPLLSNSSTKAFWPNPQDYNENIQNPSICFADEELKNGRPELTALGLPKVATGAFASVYRLHCGKTDWAVRCFSAAVKDQDDRYQKTSRFICSDDLPYTVPLQYLKEGIRIHGQWFPILKMEWVEGISIYAYIDKYFQNRNKMIQLHDSFMKMMDELRLAGIAHSDLQHGNIIMRNDEIVLVDYDGMFVPELSGYMSLERGHPNYQHPEREARHFGPYLDNFSAWLIDTCILSLIDEPSFWHRFAGDAESLLFKRNDLISPEQSTLFKALYKHHSNELKERAHYLLFLLAAHMEQIPYLQKGCPPLLAPVKENPPIGAEAKLAAQLANQSESETKSYGLPDWMK